MENADLRGVVVNPDDPSVLSQGSCRTQGLGLKAQGLGDRALGVWGLGLRGLGFRVTGLKPRRA